MREGFWWAAARVRPYLSLLPDLATRRFPRHLAVLLALVLAMVASQPLLQTGVDLGGDGVSTQATPQEETVLPAPPTPAPIATPQLEPSQLREIGAAPSKEQQSAVQTNQPRAPIKYRVEEGDTVNAIAVKFGLDADSVIASNDIDDPNALGIGEELLIPPVSGLLHRVYDGDVLNELALIYGVTPEAVVEYNGIKDANTLQIGDLLVIPGGKVQMARANSTSRGGRSASAPARATGSFRWPASGTITQYFGEAGHSGLDVAAGMGSPIYAADAGVVIAAHKLGYGYGWYLMVDHENGYRSLYAHLSAFYVDYGERVSKGETIGAMGSTGLSTGPHLHFEVYSSGALVNPLKYLP